MSVTANLGFPRIGAARELKWALEHAWRDGRYDELRATAAALRERHWLLQHDRGIDRVPVGDFSLYDHVLDTALAVGVVPERFGGAPFDPESGNDADLQRYFVMARGGSLDGADRAPLELTKWLDTNYHYLVPELAPEQHFTPRPQRILDHLREARALGVAARPVLLGPVSFLRLAKRTDGGDPLALLDRLLPAYTDLVQHVRAGGISYLQFDEPLLVTDLDAPATDAYRQAYAALHDAAEGAEIMVATYFGSLGDNTELATSLPVDVLHLDLVRGREQLESVMAARPDSLALSLGLVDGRNIWRSDMDALIPIVERAVDQLGTDAVQLAPSCSLLHLPVDLTAETALDADLLSWLAFATERLDEIRILGCVADGDAASVEAELDANLEAAAARRASPRVHDRAVAGRLAAVADEMAHRNSPYGERRSVQAEALKLPLLPTTTIGSFPQTPAIREERKKFRQGVIDEHAYSAALREEVTACVRRQEDLGLDVLVHGEFERTDMVEYFGEHLDGYFTTANGWVQSFGSRCVKPPAIYGDIVRPRPVTVEWSTFAAGLTDRPVKGMLTGPVTMLQWSFVRDDQPRSTTCRQLALAVRDEIDDLVSAGLQLIQVDEPGLREGMPLRRSEQGNYLAWATEAFRLATSSVPDNVQIHTHMCYAEFGDIIDAIVDLDADVISFEASRSQLRALGDFVRADYPNEVGPGLWDIHSPRVPPRSELDGLLDRAIDAFGSDRLWVNPDCGLKTRGWTETTEALTAMVAAAAEARSRLAASSSND